MKYPALSINKQVILKERLNTSAPNNTWSADNKVKQVTETTDFNKTGGVVYTPTATVSKGTYNAQGQVANVTASSVSYAPAYNSTNGDEALSKYISTLSFNDSLNVALSGYIAMKDAERLYSPSQLSNGDGDAQRHAEWSALMVQTVTETIVRGATQAQEEWVGNPEAEKAMDLFNDEVGIEIGKSFKGITPIPTGNIRDKVQQYVKDGYLAKLSGNTLVPTGDKYAGQAFLAPMAQQNGLICEWDNGAGQANIYKQDASTNNQKFLVKSYKAGVNATIINDRMIVSINDFRYDMDMDIDKSKEMYLAKLGGSINGSAVFNADKSVTLTGTKEGTTYKKTYSSSELSDASVFRNVNDHYVVKDYNSFINSFMVPANKVSEVTGDTITADQLRQKVVNLAKNCIGKIEYVHKSSVILTNADGSIKSGLQLDCSSFVSSLYYTIFGIKGKLDDNYDAVKRTNGGGADRESQMGVEVQNLKNSDGTINYSALKPGDLLFFDYGLDGVNHPNDPDGADREGIYEHVAVYIGNGQFIDTATHGCSINTSSSLSGADTKKINDLHWSSPVNADIHDMVLTARRIIQDDGSIKVV